MIVGLYRDKHFNLSNIHILHFVGHPKPWQGGRRGYECVQRIWGNIPNITSNMLSVPAYNRVRWDLFLKYQIMQNFSS